MFRNCGFFGVSTWRAIHNNIQQLFFFFSGIGTIKGNNFWNPIIFRPRWGWEWTTRFLFPWQYSHQWTWGWEWTEIPNLFIITAVFLAGISWVCSLPFPTGNVPLFAGCNALGKFRKFPGPGPEATGQRRGSSEALNGIFSFKEVLRIEYSKCFSNNCQYKFNIF